MDKKKIIIGAIVIIAVATVVYFGFFFKKKPKTVTESEVQADPIPARVQEFFNDFEIGEVLNYDGGKYRRDEFQWTKI